MPVWSEMSGLVLPEVTGASGRSAREGVLLVGTGCGDGQGLGQAVPGALVFGAGLLGGLVVTLHADLLLRHGCGWVRPRPGFHTPTGANLLVPFERSQLLDV